MKYHVLVGDHHHEVELQRVAGGLVVTLGGQTLRFDVATLEDGRAYSLIIDDRSIDVGVEEAGDSLELLISGRRYSTEVLGEREWLARSIQLERGGGDKLVRAVMTGIVRDVLVAPGDRVVEGQILFILEAMKMENEVKSGVEGTVSAVHVQTGSTVEKDVVVVEIA